MENLLEPFRGTCLLSPSQTVVPSHSVIVFCLFTPIFLLLSSSEAHAQGGIWDGGFCVLISCGCLSVFPISVSHIRISSAVRQLRLSHPARCFVLPPNRCFVRIRPPLSLDKPAFVRRFQQENGNIPVLRGALQNGDFCCVPYQQTF